MTNGIANPNKVLFIDGAQIGSMRGVERQVHAGEKFEANPVLGGDSELERQTILGTVLKENGLYRMWYQCDRFKWHNYAESDDGVEWRKPVFRRYRDANGSLDNNLYLDPEIRNHDYSSVMPTPHQGGGREYTMIAYRAGNHHICHSEDGLNWTPWSSEPVIPGFGDLGWYIYDVADALFRVMIKRHLLVRGRRCRVQHWAVSEDGYDWSMPQPAIVPDLKDEEWTGGDPDMNTQIYGIPIARYGPLLVGFMDVFRCTDPRGINMAGVIDTQLVSSRDGRHWERVGDRRPVLEMGPKGAWDGGFVRSATALVESGDELRLYYTGMDHPHEGQKKRDWKRAIGFVSWRMDGFVGLRADGEGEVVTVVLDNCGDLHLNADASGGRVSAEILGEDGTVVTGFEAESCTPLEGRDAIDHPLRWKGAGSRVPEGVSVRLKLRDAEVFSLWWE